MAMDEADIVLADCSDEVMLLLLPLGAWLNELDAFCELELVETSDEDMEKLDESVDWLIGFTELLSVIVGTAAAGGFALLEYTVAEPSLFTSTRAIGHASDAFELLALSALRLFYLKLKNIYYTKFKTNVPSVLSYWIESRQFLIGRSKLSKFHIQNRKFG